YAVPAGTPWHYASFPSAEATPKALLATLAILGSTFRIDFQIVGLHSFIGYIFPSALHAEVRLLFA
ncbi:MAG TPA: hypothetical protein VF772_16725, partial [Terriglobales bacterium]